MFFRAAGVARDASTGGAGFLRQRGWQAGFMLLAPGTVAPSGHVQNELASFRREALAGLRQPHKRLPCKFFYDETGSRLFDRICELPEYYLTRTELSIMRRHGPAMARLIGPECQVIEYGSGSSIKSLLLLDALASPVSYVPVDICRSMLEESSRALLKEYPNLEVLAVAGEYHDGLRHVRGEANRPKLILWLGSNVG